MIKSIFLSMQPKAKLASANTPVPKSIEFPI